MLNNPTELPYDRLSPGNGPKYGVAPDLGLPFVESSRTVYAWFCDLSAAQLFVGCVEVPCTIWDLEKGLVCDVQP